ncbi:MAG: hypothetical protein ACRDY2_06380 [Acidimicrobiales bacterium]
MGVEKMSVSFDLALGQGIRAAATRNQLSVSAWLARAARDQLRLEALDDAIRAWEDRFGELTEDEVLAAGRALDDAIDGGERGLGVA